MLNKIKKAVFSLGLQRIRLITVMVGFVFAVLLTLGLSVNKVTVNDGLSVQTIYSLKSQPAELLKFARLSSKEYQVTELSSTGNRINISLKYAVPVYVTIGNDTSKITVLAGSTVSDAITCAGFTLDEHDIVNMPLDTVVNETAYIDIIDIDYVTETSSVRIPYTSKTVYSDKTTGKTVTVAGSEGEKQITTLTKYVNGTAVSTDTLSETVTKEAVNQIITVGTKKAASTTSASVSSVSTLTPSSPIELDENGNPISYKSHVTVQATAYSNESGNKGASGVVIKPGYVAVNTSIYPYGTKFYIKSSDGSYIYGYAVAADTGDFVYSRPTNFDLCFATAAEARAFGRRNIEVYVLY